jgi:transposase-like protein
MVNLSDYCCSNSSCQFLGKFNQGNIAVRAVYGKEKQHILLYCKHCKATFTPTKNTPLFKAHLTMKTIRDIMSLSSQGVGVRGIAEHLKLSPKAVNHNIIKIGEHCAEHLANTILSLDLVEVQLDEFWSFIKKNVLKRIPRYLEMKQKKELSGSDQQ